MSNTLTSSCGGFPCQDISLAGRGAGIAEGTRSGLWSHYARLIEEIRPRYIVAENVSALRSRGLDRVPQRPRGAQGMARSGIAYQLPPLALLTGETGVGLWATLAKADGVGSHRGGQGRSLRTDIFHFKKDGTLFLLKWQCVGRHPQLGITRTRLVWPNPRSTAMAR